MSWLGALPLSANVLGQAQPASEPFVWGAGGARMTPEDIAFQRRLAASEQQLDYSPVGHWLQGAARLAGNVGGMLRERRADKASEANVAEGNAVLSALMGGGDGLTGPSGEDAVLAAMMNPYIPDDVKQYAQAQWERKNPKPLAPTEFERMLQASGVQPGTPDWAQAMARAVENRTDPQVTVSLPGGGIFVGPQSELANVLKGGGPVSTGPGASPPPSTLPPDFAFDSPMTPTAAAPVLSGAMASGTITPAQAQQVRSSLGPNGQRAFEAWLRNNNLTIGSQ
jgi:hypothetical protein